MPGSNECGDARPDLGVSVELIQSFFRTVYNVPELVSIGGLFGLTMVVFAETGLLVGFFLPGDSLLVTAGLFAARGDLHIVPLNLCLITAAILGDAVGYAIGHRAGTALYQRQDSFFFRKKHLIRTREFYERHGGKTIVIARFMPIIRTFAPVVAGIGQMSYRRFAAYNIWGGIGWVLAMTLAGYGLGQAFPPKVIDRYIHLIIAGIIFVSLLPGFIVWLRERNRTPPASQK